MSAAQRDLVFVTVGTDHHPFDRLIDWVDAWAAADPARLAVPCLVQSGTSKAPRHLPYRDYVRYDEMCEAMSRAVAVVSHGGPATIMDARRLGRVPIVVPRSHDLGEHVDNHQHRFARRMADLGQIHLASGPEELFSLLDRALADPDAFSLVASGDDIAAAVDRFSEMVDDLMAAGPRRRRR
ncbi:MAG: glycosyltransferase [Acidimicrobiia bacterium]